MATLTYRIITATSHLINNGDMVISTFPGSLEGSSELMKVKHLNHAIQIVNITNLKSNSKQNNILLKEKNT